MTASDLILVVTATAGIAAIVHQLLKTKTKKKKPPSLVTHVEIAPGWEEVEEAFRDIVAEGGWPGAGFAVYHRGERVVHLTGGWADEEAQVPWDTTTLSQLNSSTKSLAGVGFALLYDKGLLEYDKTVSHYWPNFGQNGKEHITVEQLLSHQAGLPYFDEQFEARDVTRRPEKLTRLMEKQKPHWTPGTLLAYHAATIGLYCNELASHIDPDRRKMATIIEDEFITKLDLDLFIGLPRSENYRSAKIYPIPPEEFASTSSIWTTLRNYVVADPLASLLAKTLASFLEITMPSTIFNNPYVREVPFLSSNGFATVDSAAKLYGVLANGGSHKSLALISERGLSKLHEPVVSGHDAVLRRNVTYGRGTTLIKSPSEEGYTFGAPGFGGQMVYADPRWKLGWAFLTNHYSARLFDHVTYVRLSDAMFKAARKIEEGK